MGMRASVTCRQILGRRLRSYSRKSGSTGADDICSFILKWNVLYATLGAYRSMSSKLQKFFAKVDRCASCRAAKNPLRHVFGGGKAQTPKYFFLFINPTHKNISTQPTYAGRRRYPFMGVRHFYRELSQAGFVDAKIIAD